MARKRRPHRRRQVTTETDPGAIAGDDEADEAEPETGPLRRCIVTRERLPKERMIRFVVGPDRQIVPDLAAKLPGRGIWLSASWDVLQSNGAPGYKGRQDQGVEGERVDG